VIEVIDCEQYSPEWWQARLGIPTASEFHAVLAKGEGKTRRKYMMQLIGERLSGEPGDGYSNPAMERGHIMEAEARDLYAFRTDHEPIRVGFIRNGEKGCSPDALIEEGGILEIKTRAQHLQVEVLLANRLPPEHVAQCQGSLWVSEREWLDYVSYCPRLPLFVTRVHRDETYIARLAAEVDLFNRELQTYLKHLTDGAALP
jgi:hypothetical protein